MIHYVFPSDVESYVQETGRAGRDGNLAIATVVKKSRAGEKRTRLSSNMLQIALSVEETPCLVVLMTHCTFVGPLCICCDACCEFCPSLNCCNTNKSFVFI